MRFLVILAAFVAACLPVVLVEQQPMGANCSRKSGIPDHVPEYLAGVRQGDRLSGDRQLDLRVVLQMRDLDGLNAFLAAMTTPGTPAYGVPMDPVVFASRHLPTAEQAASAVAALRAHGLDVDAVPRGALLHAKATSAQAERAFQAAIVSTEGGGYAPNGQLSMPNDAIRAIKGLALHDRPRQWSTPQDSSAEPPLTPARIRQAYNIPQGAAGAGQTLAIVGLDGFDPADMAAYARAHGLREVPIKPAYMGHYDGAIITDAGKTETTLDLQLLGAVANEAEAIYAVLASPDSPHGLIDALNWLANPPAGVPHIKHISCSWGVAESGTSQASMQVTETVLKQLAATGATLHSASGDLGAFDDGSSIKAVDTPASSVWSNSVGGTSLRLGPPRTETTWAGSGGGYSCFWPAPAWQAQAWGQTAHEVMRAMPDVAFAADPFTPYAIWVDGHASSAAGTSAAAPVSAAIGALIAEARQKAGKPPVGFLPPLLYQASGNLPDNGFVDIVLGQSDIVHPGEGIKAVPGYDCATGLGSINVGQILHYLTLH